MKQYSIIHTDDLNKTLWDNGYVLYALTSQAVRQLRSCQARVLDGQAINRDTNELVNITVLQSYNTLVAYKMNGKTIRCGYYSPTTSRQTSWFSREWN